MRFSATSFGNVALLHFAPQYVLLVNRDDQNIYDETRQDSAKPIVYKLRKAV